MKSARSVDFANRLDATCPDIRVDNARACLRRRCHYSTLFCTQPSKSAIRAGKSRAYRRADTPLSYRVINVRYWHSRLCNGSSLPPPPRVTVEPRACPPGRRRYCSTVCWMMVAALFGMDSSSGYNLKLAVVVGGLFHAFADGTPAFVQFRCWRA